MLLGEASRAGRISHEDRLGDDFPPGALCQFRAITDRALALMRYMRFFTIFEPICIAFR